MTIRDFAGHLTKNQLYKGETYFHRQKVQSLTVNDFGRWIAKVQGRRLYEVQISIRNEQIRRVSCECIAHAEDAYCKHVVAVLFAIQQREGILKTSDELQAMVKKMSTEELRRFIVEQAVHTPELQYKLSEWVEEEEEEKGMNPASRQHHDPATFSKAVQHLYARMCKAVDKKAYAKAKDLAEQAMQEARKNNNLADYTHIQISLLLALQPSTDVMGLREYARRFYKESRNIYFYRILKATYVAFEWQKVVTAHIARLEKKIPAYAAGIADPAELADVYLEEYDDGDTLLELLKQVPCLSFVNAYAPCLGSGYDGDVLLVYREALLNHARQSKPSDDTTSFQTAIQKVMELKGGQQAARELADEIASCNKTLFGMLPNDIRNNALTGHSFFTTLALARNTSLIEKGRMALSKQQYREAMNIGLAIVAVVPPPFTGRNYADKETEAIEYIKKGFYLLLDLCKANPPASIRQSLYEHAWKMAPEPQYVLSDYQPHWIELLVELGKGKEEQVLMMVEQLLQKQEKEEKEDKSMITVSIPILRLLKIKTALLKALGQPHVMQQLMTAYPKLHMLREYFISEAEKEGEIVLAKQLAEEGLQMYKGDRVQYTRYRDLCLKLAHHYNDPERLRALAQELYAETKDLTYYLLIKNTYSEKDWPAVAETSFIDNLENRMGPKNHYYVSPSGELAAIYATEQYYDRLLSVLQRAKQFSLTQKYTGTLCERFPAALLELYYEGLAEYAENNKHAEAIEFIVKTMKQMKKWEGGAPVVKKLVNTFRTKYPTRTKLLQLVGKI